MSPKCLCCRMRSNDKIEAACAYSGGTSSSEGWTARCCAASFWTNFSTTDRSCCKDWLSSSSRNLERACCLAFSTSSNRSTKMPMPVCCAPRPGNTEASPCSLAPLPAAARSKACASLPRSAETLTAASWSEFRSHVSSAAESRLAARSRNRPDAEARSSTFCWTVRDSSFNRCLASCFFCWCACHRSSRSLRCSSQARSTWVSMRWPKSFAWCKSSCCSAWLCERSACSHNCFTFASREATSSKRFSSQRFAWACSASWNSASAWRITSSCNDQPEPACCACDTNSTLASDGKLRR
mmetsp:Transcript_129658/g.375533  ORF Transcript_129658/g.375533 Transcript_129658/m.375533 type:complete len:297 (+) Transcript_129658:144-1034(+)